MEQQKFENLVVIKCIKTFRERPPAKAVAVSGVKTLRFRWHFARKYNLSGFDGLPAPLAA